MELRLRNGERIEINPTEDVYLWSVPWGRDGRYQMPGWSFTFNSGAACYGHPIGESRYILYILRWAKGEPDRIEPLE